VHQGRPPEQAAEQVQTHYWNTRSFTHAADAMIDELPFEIVHCTATAPTRFWRVPFYLLIARVKSIKGLPA
jgi:hypothetical protein